MGHRVVEIGALRLENWRPVAEISQLIQPGRALDPGASRVHGINDEDLIGKPAFAEIADDLLALLDGALLVAHNAAFDAGFVGMEFYLGGYVTSEHAPTPANPWLCTLQLARRRFHFGRNNLGAVARQLNIRVDNAHRALADVYTTAAILKRMSEQLQSQGVETVGDLLQAQGGPIYAPPPAQPVALPPLLAEALASGGDLHIEYAARRGSSRRIITPKYVTTRSGGAYVIAYCHLRHEQRTFRLDRILSMEPVGDG
jgi:DNA polymerase-3 subunit epsilon